MIMYEKDLLYVIQPSEFTPETLRVLLNQHPEIKFVSFMGIDFATGMITGAMAKSKHSKTGKLNSKAGWYGLAKKGSILMLIIVAVRLDILLNTNYVRDAVCIAFCVNELLSIVENTSLMGIPYPPALKNAIEVLQKQTGRKDDNDD